MKVVVIGLGSMGKRRIRLLRKIFGDSIDLIGVDSNGSRCDEIESLFAMDTVSDLDEAIDRYHPEVGIVSTSPLSHGMIISKLLQSNCHVFTEINLVDDDYDRNISLARDRGRILFLSSTMRYRMETDLIGDAVNKCNYPVNYIYHVGQYLPTWHPWESYSNFFVNDARTNGCREIFAIELPWLVKVFGPFEILHVDAGNMTDLKINYDDYYVVNILHSNGSVGVVNFNVASLNPVRHFEMYGQDCFLRWDGTPDSLFEYDAANNEMVRIGAQTEQMTADAFNSSIVEDAYEKELRSFFEAIMSGVEPEYSFEEDKIILKMIDAIEKADK